MKRWTVGTLALALCGLAPDLGGQELPPPEERARIAREMARAAEPGPDHERIVGLAGDWEVELLLWSDPASDPVRMTGRARASSILGGRFLDVRERVEAEPPFEARTVLGHDNRWGEYTLVQMDTWGTYWVTARGPYDPTSRTLLLSGEDADPLARHVQRYEVRVLLEGPDAWRVQVWMKDPVHTRGAAESVLLVEHRYQRTGGGDR